MQFYIYIYIYIYIHIYILWYVCYIARYTDVWNRHRESEMHDIHEIGSGTKLCYLWVKGYSTWGERGTIFLCWLYHLTTPPHHVRHLASNYWSGLGGPRKSTFFLRGKNSTLFFHKSQPMLPVRDVTHIPWSQLLSGIFILTSLNDTSSLRAREHLR